MNGELADVDWVPIRYLNKSFSRRTLFGFLRLAQVGLVTPLRDGMNLVAMEYLASQPPDDPGVLVLSRFAGAARYLRDALIVNPYDVEGVAETIQTALTMPAGERWERWQSSMKVLRSNSVEAWYKRDHHSTRRGIVRTLRPARTVLRKTAPALWASRSSQSSSSPTVSICTAARVVELGPTRDARPALRIDDRETVFVGPVVTAEYRHPASEWRFAHEGLYCGALRRVPGSDFETHLPSITCQPPMVRSTAPFTRSLQAFFDEGARR